MGNNHNNIFKCYNRDLSWMLFNRRVIFLANKSETPFLNKLQFLAIAANNLDEFYSVRVPSIQTQLAITRNGIEKKSGLSYDEILQILHQRNDKNFNLQYDYYHRLCRQLSEQNLCHILKYDQLNHKYRNRANQFFDQFVLPLLGSTSVHDFHKISYLRNKQIGLAVVLKVKNKRKIRIVPVPPELDRVISLSESCKKFILIEDLIRNNLDNLFDGSRIENVITFRIIRDLDATLDVEKNDNSEETIHNLRHYLANREKGRVTMFAVENHSDLTNELLNEVVEKLKIDKRGLYVLNGPVDLGFLMQLIKPLMKTHLELIYPKYSSRQWPSNQSMWNYLDHHDLLLQYPYDSFNQFLSFLRESVENPKTLAIKQTIYRAAQHSQVISLLKTAAKKGIAVTVVVELRARFDEAHNLKLANELQEAGCHVVFGKKYFKVHSKACLVLTKLGPNPRGYAQIGTGNYNEDSAKQFVDLSLFSSQKNYVQDLVEFFDYLEELDSRQPKYKILSASPHRIEDMVIQNIRRVKEYYKKSGEGHVFLKINSLTDVDLINAIYDAAEIGLSFCIVVRGACCLRLGICGKNENIVLYSIVGELLEHSRIYAFYDDKSSIWISSADLMTRNMDSRVELAAPILDQNVKEQVQKIIDIYEYDDVDSYYLRPNGHYIRYNDPEGFSAQQTFIHNLNHKLPNKNVWDFIKDWIQRLIITRS